MIDPAAPQMVLCVLTGWLDRGDRADRNDVSLVPMFEGIDTSAFTAIADIEFAAQEQESCA